MMAPVSAGYLRVLIRHAGKPSSTLRSTTPQVGRLFTRQYAAAAPAAVSHHPTIPDIIEKSPLGFATESSAVLHRTLKSNPLQVVSANGTNVTFSNGQTMEDTTCGAGVACIGYNNERVKNAMVEQIDKFAYCNSMFFGTPIGEQLAANLIDGTNGEMSKAYIMCSGQCSIHRSKHGFLTFLRIRGHGVRHEDGEAVLLRAQPQTDKACQLYCA
jgi:hypothetical protein